MAAASRFAPEPLHTAQLRTADVPERLLPLRAVGVAATTRLVVFDGSQSEHLVADVTPTRGADVRDFPASPKLDVSQDNQGLLPRQPDQHLHRKGLADACVLLAPRRRDGALGPLVVAHR